MRKRQEEEEKRKEYERKIRVDERKKAEGKKKYQWVVLAVGPVIGIVFCKAIPISKARAVSGAALGYFVADALLKIEFVDFFPCSLFSKYWSYGSKGYEK